MISRTRISFRHPALALILFLTAVGLSHAEKMTLAKCVGTALENNPSVKIAKENVLKTAADIDLASAQGMPRLILNSTFTRTNKYAPLYEGISLLNTRYANLSIAQPLDIFGIIKTGRRMAHLGRISAEYDYEKTKNDLALQVKTSYYDVLRAQQNLRVQEDASQQLEAHLKDAQVNLAAGTVSKFEVLRAETETANAKLNLISAQNAVKLAKSSLNSVMGRNLDTPIELEEPAQPKFVDVKLEECIDSACKWRPEMKSADTQVELSGKMITIAQREKQPKVNLLYNYDQNSPTPYVAAQGKRWDAALKSSVSILDGGAARAHVGQAVSDAANAKYGQKQATLGVSMETRQAYLDLKASRQRIAAADKGLSLARESMRLADVRYKAGMSTQVEVFDARAMLTSAESYYINALYDYQIALAKLEKAVGGETQMAKLIKSNPIGPQVAEVKSSSDTAVSDRVSFNSSSDAAPMQNIATRSSSK